MKINQYFRRLRKIIDSNPFVTTTDISEDTRTNFEGAFKGRIYFVDGSFLDFREYVNTSGKQIKKYAYSYHFQKLNDLVFRYDNAPHHPEIVSFPHHKHLGSGEIIESPEANFEKVLEEITRIIK